MEAVHPSWRPVDCLDISLDRPYAPIPVCLCHVHDTHICSAVASPTL